jgi:hypothetical protein
MLRLFVASWLAAVVACAGNVQQYKGPFKEVAEVPNPADIEYINFVDEVAEFIATRINKDAPNESLFCLYGEVDDKVIKVDLVTSNDFKATPIRIVTPANLPTGCETNNRYLGTLHTHPMYNFSVNEAQQMGISLCELSPSDYRTFLMDKSSGMSLVLCANGYMACQLRGGGHTVIKVLPSE